MQLKLDVLDEDFGGMLGGDLYFFKVGLSVRYFEA